MAKVTDPVIEPVLPIEPTVDPVLPVEPTVDPVLPVEPSVEEGQAGLEEVEIGLEEPLVYAASEITKDLLLVKEFTLQSDCVLKSQIATLLDQAIQTSLVK